MLGQRVGGAGRFIQPMNPADFFVSVFVLGGTSILFRLILGTFWTAPSTLYPIHPRAPTTVGYKRQRRVLLVTCTRPEAAYKCRFIHFPPYAPPQAPPTTTTRATDIAPHEVSSCRIFA